MGALLDSAIKEYGSQLLLSDPFSGGGTVTFEAVRRGLRAYAQDVYPWPAEGLTVALSAACPNEFDVSADDLLKRLQPFRSRYRRADGRELTHILRIRVARCGSCRQDIHLFQDAMVSRASRDSNVVTAYFGCMRCGSVSLRAQDSKRPRCESCRGSINFRNAIGGFTCPHCDAEFSRQQIVASTPRWKPILVQELSTSHGRQFAVLRPVEAGDPVRWQDASILNRTLRQEIGPGKETQRLINSGFRTWANLFSHAQVEILLGALEEIEDQSSASSIRDRLAYAALGLAEMPASLCRWDRYHLKPFEATANHRYASTTLAVEINPLSPVGRGTLQRRLRSARLALRWLHNSCKKSPAVRRVKRRGPSSLPQPGQVLVRTGSSESQFLPDKSVHLALTDPPYFDDVQYGELARLFHVWLSLYRKLPAINEHQEAVPNSVRGTSATDYEKAITACFRETRRTLARNGRLILTFHNTKMVAWKALAGALCRAEFAVHAIAVVQAENPADHSKRYARSMLHDLVLECRRSRRRGARVRVAHQPKSATERNLLAMGRALATAIAARAPEKLPGLYRSALARSGLKKVLVA